MAKKWVAKKTVRKTFEDAVALRKALQQALHKSVHRNPCPRFISRAEQLIAQCRPIFIDGMSEREFQMLCDLEDLQELVVRLTKHL